MIFWIPVRSLLFALLLPAAGVFAGAVPAGASGAVPGNGLSRTIAPLFPAAGTSADEAAPVVAGLSPAHEAADVKASAKLEITFTEEVVAGEGDITITVDGTAQTLAANSKDVKINKDKVTLNLPGNFPDGAQVSVLVPAGAFKDETGNAFAGIAAGEWRFTIAGKDAPADETAPTVAGLSPADGTTEVPRNAKLEITFSEEVRAGTGQISIATNGNTQTLAVGSNAVRIDQNKVTIDLGGELPEGAVVSIQVPQGGFEDLAGNDFAGLAAGDWNFTMQAAPADDTAPVWVNLSPADDTEVEPSSKPEIGFSEEVQAGTGDITITVNGTAQTVGVRTAAVKINKEKVTIEVGDFPAGATVSVVVPEGAFVDKAGNAFAGFAAGEWNFTTLGAPAPTDNAPPVVAGLSPGDDATEVAQNAKLEITFSEEVVAGSKDIIITVNGTAQLVGSRTSAVQINKEKVTIDPPADFPAGAAVSVVVPAGTFEDMVGNDFAGTAAGSWNFTVKPAADEAPPVVAGLSPDDEATEVAENEKLEITFSEEVQAGNGDITITVNGTPQTVGARTAAVKINKEKVTIDAANFPAGATVSVVVPAGAFEDAAGNDFAGIAATGWNFTVKPPADNKPPAITDRQPANNDKDVAVNARLVLDFDEKVNKGQGQIVLSQADNSQNIDISSEQVSVNGSKVTISHPKDFSPGSSITVRIPQGAFQDEVGNPFAGINDWTFRTAEAADETAPTVTTLSPDDNATEVAENAKLEITFSEEVQAGTGNITITVNGTPQTVGVRTAAVKINKDKVTIEAAADFPAGAAVSVVVPAGAFEDAAGNDFAGLAAGSWNFTVKPPVDNTAPTVAGLSPDDDATGVAISTNSLEITFDENINKGSGNITLTGTGFTQTVDVATNAVKVNGKKATIDLSQALPYATALAVTVPAGAFEDETGNDFAGLAAAAWTFTTVDAPAPIDQTAPTVATLSPDDDATEVAENAKLEITFSEEVQAGNGDITITVNGTAQTVDVTTNTVRINKEKVTINAAANFPEGATVSVVVPAGAFEDAAGNDFAGLTAANWNFTVKPAVDNTPPVVAGMSPSDDTKQIVESTNLELTFSEAVVAGTGDITITINGTPQTVGVRTNVVNINKEKITIDPAGDFPAGAEVSVVVPAGAFEDAAGNDFAGIAAGGWDFTVTPAADEAPPVVAGLSPANGTADVAISTNSLEITFDENITKGSGNITVTGEEVDQSISVATNAVKVNGKKATIDLSQALPYATALAVTVPAGAFEDETGNDFAGIAASAWTFTTVDAPAPTDQTAPTVATLSPDDDATEVAENAKLELTFSEEVQAGTGDITITVNGTPQTVDVTTNAVRINKEKVTIEVAANFPAGATVSVVVPAGAFEDAAGNDFAGVAANDWNFTVKPPVDNKPPAITAREPANNDKDVAVNARLVIDFDEKVKKGQGQIVLSQADNTQNIDISSEQVSVNGSKVTISHSKDFSPGSSITVQIPQGAFQDEVGNPFPGVNDWTFRTAEAADETAPTVTTLSPDDNATEVAENAKLEITFSEEVQAGTGDITITVNGTSQTVGVRTAAVKINKEKVTIEAAADFPAGAAVSVVVPAGAFEDTAGNDFAGLAAGSWNFTVKPPVDNTAPTVAGLSPDDDATGVAINTNSLEITFDENINKGSGNITLTGTGFTQTVDVATNAVKVNGKKATIDLTQALPYATAITVTVPAGAFEDETGNDFAGLAASAWTFTTVDAPAPIDETAPTVATLSPDDNATEVAENAKLEVTFSEEVQAGTGDITITVNGTPQTVDVTTNAVRINKEKVTIDAAANFPAGATVSVAVPAGAFEDAAGNDFTGIAAGNWNFTVKPPVDNTPPVITAREPANNDKDVAVNARLVIDFDEKVKKGQGQIVLSQADNSQNIDISSEQVSVNGSKVTISHSKDFSPGSSITVRIPQGAFQDEVGNPFAGINDWTFRTAEAADETAPTVATLSPDDNATEVAENAKLEVTFSEEVQAGTGDITITVNGTPQTVDVTTNAVKINKEKVTIEAAANFPAGATVSVVVPAGAFEDAAGNDFAGIAAGSWNFTVKPAPTPTDNTAPVVADLSPDDDATGVAISTNSLEITFDENITKGSGNITITGTGFTQTVDVATNAVKVNGKKATIDLSQALPYATAISVTVPQGAFEDETGNDFAGIAAAAWTFTTVDAPAPTDQTAPTVATLSPDDEATEVAENAKLEVTFSEEVQAGTGDITITVNGTPQTVDVTTNAVKINKDKVTIEVAANFPAGATVSVVVPAGAFEDAAGNDFAGVAANDWNFTVKPPVDNKPPAITAREPANNDKDVAVNARLVIDFDEKVKKGQGQIVLSQADNTQNIDISSEQVSVNGSKVTISHSKDFSPGSSITVQIPQGAFQDEVGNPFAGINDWTFRTAEAADETAPTVTALSPDDNATEVAENAKLEITFSEEVQAGTGDITITVNGTPQTVGVRTAAVKINKDKVTIEAAADFPAGAAVSVVVPAGAFEDAAGNDFAGVAAGSWNFTVKPPVDNTAPTVAGLSPDDDATGVAINTNSLKITFDENINKGSGNITLTGTGFTQTVDVATNAVKVNGKKATIDLTQALPYATAISVTVPQGAFEDETGNDFAGIAAAAWTFTTVDAPAPTDQTAPTVATLSPDDEATEVAENAKLEVTFSEEVQAGTGDITITVNGTPQTVDVTTNAVKINKEKVTIDVANFPAGATVSVVVPAGAFEDAAGNDFAGIAAGSWNFTVKPAPTPTDNTAPVVADLSPDDDATGVAIRTNSLEITFDENINKGSGNITITGTGFTQTVDVTTNAVKVNGKKATIDLSQALPYATALAVTVPAGAFEDETGNDFAGIAAGGWTFTTVDAPAPIDQTAPTVAGLSPDDDATEVTENAKLEITFSEEVQAGTGDITITINGTPQTVDVTTNAVRINKEKVTIDAGANFPEGATVSVVVPAGAFEDAAGNDFTGIAAGSWNFTVKPPADNTPPVITAREPANNDKDVAVNARLVIDFDEKVKKGQGQIVLSQADNSQNIDISSEQVSVNGSKVTISHPKDFSPGSSITVRIPQGAFQDEVGNPFAGINDWTFRTAEAADETAPTLATLSPDDNATEVAENAKLEVTFSEEVQAGTGDITITVNGTPQTVDVTTNAVKINKEKVTIDAAANFPEGATVSVVVPAGAFEDAAGNDFAGIAAGSWNFTVKPAPTPTDNTAPVVADLSPDDDATGVAISTNSLEITFDENITKGSGNITITGTGFTQTVDVTTNAVQIAGKKATIDLSQVLPYATALAVTVPQGAFEDETGNDFAGIAASAWTFTTVDDPTPNDVTAPTVAGLSPDDNATEVAENAKLEITFSEEVQAGTGDITITVNGTPQTVDVTTNAVKINKEKVTIDAAANFPEGATVSVVVPAGAFEDAAGNDFAGIAAGSWNFTVKPAPTPTDNTAPVVADLSPDNGATNVAVSTNSLEITFDENINKGTGNITLTGEGVNQIIAVGTNAVKVAGRKATIDLTQALPFATAISVTVPAGAFEDETGNDFAGIAASAWRFTTVDAPAPTDVTAPVVSGLSPADEATQVAENAKLEITFSEEVQAGNGNITITINGTPQTVDVTTNAVKINKEKVTIDAAANFPEGATVSVVVPAGAFQDAAGNDFAGLAAGNWNFTVKPASTPVDDKPPVITAREPDNDADDIAVNTRLVIDFNEKVRKGQGNITLSQAGNSENISVNSQQVSIAGSRATIAPAKDFAYNSPVTVAIAAGVFQDEQGNPFAGSNDWTFRTAEAADEAAPAVANLSPADEATQVAKNAKLEITFGEEVQAGTGNITITVNGTPQTVDVTTNAVKINKEKVTIDAANFPAGATVSVVVPAGAFEDAAGNDFAGLAAGNWNFTVEPAPTPADNTAPVVADLSPANGATNVAAVTSSLEITFDENINKGTGSITITGTGFTQTVDVTTNAVRIAGKKATIDVTQTLPFATAISVAVPAGAFEDQAGNDFAGLAASAWRFTTADALAPTDVTAPVVSGLSPADESTQVAENAKLEITFSEEVQAGNGNITITINGTPQTVDVTTNAVKINKEKVTIDAANFPEGATVSVVVPAGAFEDAAGNDFAGLAAGSWNFTVEPAPTPADNTAPVVADLSRPTGLPTLPSAPIASKSPLTRTSTKAPATSPSRAPVLPKR